MLYLLMILQFTFARPEASLCDFQKLRSTKTAISQTDFIFFVPKKRVLCFESTQIISLKNYLDYKKTVISKTKTNPIYLLELQKKIYDKHLPEASAMFEMILNGEIGSLRDANNLEAFLISEHFKLNGYHTEFGAFILRDMHGGLKIYFTSHSDASVPRNDKIFRFIENDLKKGYTFEGHLHNHPFNLGNLSKDISGTTIPSPPDRKIYKDLKALYGLKNAYITNGFSTIAIPDSQFELLPEN